LLAGVVACVLLTACRGDGQDKPFAVPWDGLTFDTASGSGHLDYGHGACSLFDHVEVRQTAAEVVVTVFNRPIDTGGKFCNASLKLGSVPVTFDSAKLRRRQVADGACDENPGHARCGDRRPACVEIDGSPDCSSQGVIP
jgi:hypothetical protein